MCGLALALPVATLSAQAPTVTTPAQAAQAAEPDYFAQALAARQVADFARRNRDGAAMLVAARMLHDIPESQPAPSRSGIADDVDPAFSPRRLLEEARSLAGNDTTLLTQIRVMESEASRGVVASAFGRGLVRSVRALSPRAAYQFTVTARGGEPLRIGAIGDVGTALMMRLIDSRGRVVCIDDQNDYASVCQLVPGSAAEYRVDLLNKSAATSRAVILSN